MPYKHKNIKYGLPHEEYPKDRMVENINKMKSLLGLERDPVSVIFFFTEEDYNEYPVEEITVSMPYCVMVKQAATKSKKIKSRLEHHTCDGGTTALGLEPSTEKIESGQEYFSYNLYSSNAVARRMRAGIKSLHRKSVSTYGIVVLPFLECEMTPDVVILILNANQAMRIVQGYEYFTGKKPAIDLGAMQGICSEVTASPYITGELNVSVLCPSTRMLCKWSDEDMAVGIPYELFEMITEGIEATVPNY